MDGRVTFLIKITSPAKPSARDIYNRTIMGRDTTEETVAKTKTTKTAKRLYI